MTEKKYSVEITEQTFEIIRSFARYIAFEQKAPHSAKLWLEGLWDAVDSLEKWPKRCGFAPENDYRLYEIRKLNYGDYLLLFTIDESKHIVYIIGFRHGKQLSHQDILPNEPPQ